MSNARDVEFIFRPIERWPGKHTATPTASPFGRYGRKSLSYSQLEYMLRRELRMIGVQRAIIQLYISEAEIRNDGMPRRNARPKRPGVIISAEIPDVGWRSFFVDKFDHWHANLQALAVGFEDSRRLERYGFAKNREQYRGFPAIDPPSDLISDAVAKSREEHELAWADDVIRAYSDVDARPSQEPPEFRRSMIRRAIMRTHPDSAGSLAADAFHNVQRAREILEKL